MKQYILTTLTFLTSLAFHTTSFSCGNINELTYTNGCEITASRTYNGQYGSVSLKGYPATGQNLSLKKLVLLVSPYDPEGLESFESIKQEYLSESGLDSKLSSNGYDIVIAQYGDRSSQAIQMNSLALASAIERINSLRNSNNTYSILGLSLGGVMARYALATLEKENIDHNIRTYISYDSPHRGANVPISGQRAVSYLQSTFRRANRNAGSLFGFINLPIIDDIYSSNIGDARSAERLTRNAYREAAMIQERTIDSLAAKQLLINHIDADTSPTNSQTLIENGIYERNSNTARYQLMLDLAELGYPSQSKNTAFSNSRTDGTGYSRPANSFFLYTDDKVGDVNFRLALYTTYPSSLAISGKMRGPKGGFGSIFGDRTTYGSIHEFSSSKVESIDGAPGSYINGFERLRDSIASEYSTSVGHSSFSFIPTISALDIKQADYFDNLQYTSAGKIETLSPFDTVYTPTYNQRHLEITTDFSNKLYSEITSRHDLAWMIAVNSLLM